jgi:hypothetical protein
MSLNPNTSFRQSALALTTAAVVGTALLSGSAALAGSQACAKFGNTDAGLRCEIAESNKRIEGHNRRGAEAERRGMEADKKSDRATVLKACADFLLAGIKEGKFTREDVLKEAGGKVSDTNACPVAMKYGFGRRAEAQAPR